MQWKGSSGVVNAYELARDDPFLGADMQQWADWVIAVHSLLVYYSTIPDPFDFPRHYDFHRIGSFSTNPHRPWSFSYTAIPPLASSGPEYTPIFTRTLVFEVHSRISAK
jgi:hypothetical protein